MRSSRYLHLSSFALLWLSWANIPVSAQTVIRQFEDPSVFPGTQYYRVAALADLDGDGLGEVLVGNIISGVQLLSGANLTVLWEIHESLDSSSNVGHSMDDAGDFDGDGIHDFVMGAPDYPNGVPHGRVRVWSGATFAVLADVIGPSGSFPESVYGWDVAGIGDVNSDGFDDVAFCGFYGDVHLIAGPSGTEFRTHQGPGTRPSVAGLGDVDGDGVPDYIIGWPQDSQNGPWTGMARVYSGADGSIIHEVHGSIPHNYPVTSGDHLGRQVASAGDIDGDGVPDFICGAPGEIDYGFSNLNSRVFVYSGADASTLLQIDGDPGTGNGGLFGIELAGGQDVNGDGVPDLVIGAPRDRGPFIQWSGAVSVFSGRTGVRLWRVFTELFGRTGERVALCGDLNGDGLADFASGDAEWNDGRGRILVWAGFPADAESLCPGQPNSVGPGAALELAGDLGIESWQTLEVVGSGLPPGQFGLVYYGPGTASVPFGDGIRCVGGPFYRLGPAQQVDPAGELHRTLDFTVPPLGGGPGQVAAGSTVSLQIWYRDPGFGQAGFNLSEAVRATFAP